MLEQLLNLVKEQAGNAVVNNPAVPNEHNDGVIAEATSSITGGLQQELANGGLQNVLKMFGGQGGSPESSSLVQNISGNFAQNIMSKFGISGDQAQSIASSLIPSVMGKLVNKTNDPNDNSFSLQGIVDHLTGGQAGGLNIGSLLGSVTQAGGLDQNKDGKVDLQDVAGMVSNAVKGQQGTQEGGGGILNAIKGLFGSK